MRGEVPALKSRLDLIVFDDKYKALCIIEVKAKKRIREKERKYKQITKYETLFNLPIIMCLNMSQVDQTIEKVEEICQPLKNQ